MGGVTRLTNERGYTSDSNPLQVAGTFSAEPPVGGSTEAKQDTTITDLGAVTETAPASDTASSGLNGRLQRIAQRITSLIALVPTSLGQKAKTTSLAVTLASDEDLLATNGAVADAAVAAGATGSLSAKLRSISRDLIANIVLAAGENLIGKVAGTALVVIPTIVVDTAVYAAGDCVGGKITLANAVRVSGGSSLLYSMHVFDRSNQKPTGNILLFNADPTAATITDNAAFVYSTDDFKQITRVPLVTADYASVNSKASAGLVNIGRMVKAASGTTLYAVFVTDGAPDFVNTTDLQIIFNFIPVD